MGLQLILGGSGTGKTTLMYKEIIENSINEKRGKYLAIVPEQFTMETQKKIVELSPGKGTMAIDILSFDRLAKRIFDEAGMNTLEVLDDTGKCLILRKIIEENKNKLTVFGSKVKMAGFIDEMKSMVSELYQYGIGEEQLEDMINKSIKKPLLYGKLEDIKLITIELKKYLKDRFVMNEELLQKVCELIPNSSIIKDSYITFDEYTGFSPVQYDVIKMLLVYAKKITVTLTIREADKRNFKNTDEKFDVFGLTIKTVNKLKKAANDEGVEIFSDIVLWKSFRFEDNEPIKYLEENIFKYGKTPFEKETKDALSVHICQNAVKEAEYVAFTIKKLVREEGYRYKDIAVVTSDMESYHRVISEVFEKNGIPTFIDYKRNIIANPMVESLRGILEMIADNYSYEAVFRLLKCGLTSLERSEIDILENYVISYGIRGAKKYFSEFNTELNDINLAREKLVNDTKEIYDLFKSEKRIKVKDAITALYKFTVNLSMEEKLNKMQNFFENNNKLSLAKEYSQIYGKVMELFDKTVFLIGDEDINAKELLSILDSGFEDIKVGITPPTLDRIVVGDIERTRLSKVSVLFLMGVNDGLIPKGNSKGSVLTKMERKYLSENEVELSPTAEESVFIQKYYLYLICTKMSDKLFISFKRINGDGSSARPSYIVNNIAKMFKKLNIVDEEISNEEKEIDRITNIGMAKNFLSENIRDYITNSFTEEKIKLFREVNCVCKRNNVEVDDIIEASIYENKHTQISEALSKAIYGDVIRNSVSRLEKFASCAYQHFINYGLVLMPRREFEVNSADIGNIYHNAIELFSRKVISRKISWDKMDDELRDLLVNESVNEAVSADGREVFSDNARNAFMLERIKKITKKTAWILQEQIKAGKFEPKEFEVKFSSDFGLTELEYTYDNGSKMGLKGIIDRVDYYNDGDDIYIRIVDYKSGNKKFEINDVYNGLQLQLVLYMEAAMETIKKSNPDKNVHPAGIFYYRINDPVIDSDTIYNDKNVITARVDTKKEVIAKCIQEQVLKKQIVEGIVNESDKVIKAMDKRFDTDNVCGIESVVIPFGYTEKGGIKASSKQVSEFDIEKLIKFVHNKVGKLGEEILEGKIDVDPYVKVNTKGNENTTSKPCTYCEFNSICGFDKKLKGCDYRKLPLLGAKDVWEKIRLNEK